ncbi:MAG: zf-HC2 domain-containing protein [Gemmatimonadetes bacterium]|nr:zf-HC2 domain-containing protein [Gemmatimonadota bacterium]MCC6771394.1 zf-HC2 domain-containing protein [Gemmatimonadaceae bacterium]
MSDDMPMLDCRSAMQQLWDYVDGELTAERMQAVERHLDACANCHPHAEFAERFLAALHQTREDRSCPQDVRAKVMASLRDAGMKVT